MAINDASARATAQESSTHEILYRFLGDRDGAFPTAGVAVADGVLFGTTYSGGGSRPACRFSGCGTVYELQRVPLGYAERVLHRFDEPDGVAPRAGLTIEDRSLFGLTIAGGANAKGTFYRLKPASAEGFAFGKLFAFDGGATDGGTPVANLLPLGNALYGVSTSDACQCGIVFKFREANGRFKQSLVYSLSEQDGSSPQGALVADPENDLFGTSTMGGKRSARCYNGCGTVFTVNASGAGFAVLHDFSGPDGDGPVGGLWRDSRGNLFGTTPYGGTSCGSVGCGVIFELSSRSQSGYTERTIYAFKGGPDGESPWSSLVGDRNGNLYGTTMDGGRYCNCGTIFALKPLGRSYAKTTLYSLRGGTDGSGPMGTLVIDGRYVYGTTRNGGTGCGQVGCGTIFRVPLP